MKTKHANHYTIAHKSKILLHTKGQSDYDSLSDYSYSLIDCRDCSQNDNVDNIQNAVVLDPVIEPFDPIPVMQPNNAENILADVHLENNQNVM